MSAPAPDSPRTSPAYAALAVNRRCRRFIVAACYLIPGIALFYFVWRHGLDGDALLHHADRARAFANLHPLAALALFFSGYLITVLYSLPTTVALNLLAGYLFGALTGALAATLAATLGAYLLYRLYACLFSRSRLTRYGNPLPERPFGLILLLRLSPVFPAPLINAAAGIYRVHPPTFLSATFIGSLPLILVYTWIGGSLEHMHSVRDLLSTELLVLFGLLTAATLLVMLLPSVSRIRRVVELGTCPGERAADVK